MSDQTGRTIRDFVLSRFPGVELDDDVDIFTLGFVNSLFAMELVMFLEKEFGLRIPNEEMSLDNFRTVSAMSALVGRLRTPDAASVGEA
ncbi:acyl carrier protein [Streptomyces carpaticus]|uniref:Acyl carrier protein n=2 Tax=Streptomyces TaxID=1883 RepID=A0A1I6R023_9ACTN|nr:MULTISPECIES: acyl carrier protein [Streptomyces]MCK1813967.1 acyl carrier protein [Streptomyces sp. XM4011]QKV67614.1 acyl carrier protein [Streptomyces harbinensis]UWM47902.1 acyl carrier protein [Streptomyces carpaticus]SFS58024.1 Acyl carrier protein [Streptomyces harbinensis]